MFLPSAAFRNDSGDGETVNPDRKSRVLPKENYKKKKTFTDFVF